VRGFIDRVADGIAVLLLEGGGRAYVPVTSLPAGAAAGRVVEMTVTVPAAPTEPDQIEEVAALIERLRAGEHRHG
jgi:hypothetical protein